MRDMGIGRWLMRAFTEMGARYRVALTDSRTHEVVPVLRDYPVGRRFSR
jgi:hypothetical protein